MNYYGVLEKPKDEAGQKRAEFYLECFGGMAAPLLDDRAALLAIPMDGMVEGGKVKPYYRADVFRDEGSRERFAMLCLKRHGGEKAMRMASAFGFYPVNVDGITLVSSEQPLFGL